MKRLFVVLPALLLATASFAQINAKLIRHVDVSDTQIAFVFGGDIWLVPKTGGTAIQLTNSVGEEERPNFSPDGTEIAYTANYNGNRDVYVIPVTGGIPTRVTYQSHIDNVVGWHPDGERILFASRRDSGTQRVSKFFLVGKSGGLAEKLNVPYGELGSFSPDGNSFAYVTRLAEHRPFKRYRGGYSSDVYIYDLENNSAVNITASWAIDAKPQWVGDKIFFISDQDANMRLNIWAYDTQDQSMTQVTHFTDFDITYLGASSNDLVFDVGGELYHMNTDTLEAEPVSISVVSDLTPEIPRSIDVSGSVANFAASPGGKRVAFEARGELFDVPVKEGYSENLSQSSGAFDHSPAWSPDGATIAYWSDQSGEFQVHLRSTGDAGGDRQLTDRNSGFGYSLNWSPDSSMIAYIDETNTINIVDVESGDTREAGNYYWNLGHGSRFGYNMAWSPDSRWLSFTQGLENANQAMFIYDTESNDLHQVTSGFYNDANPAFSPDGLYLFLTTNRNLSAVYSDLDATWIYPNSSQLAAISLSPDTPSLVPVKNDAIAPTDEDDEEENGENGEEEAEVVVDIDFDDMESRLVLLPPTAGNFGKLFAFDNKVAYLRFPNSGSADENANLVFYDIEEREEKTIFANVSRVSQTADGKALLIASDNRYGIVDPEPEQKLEDPVPTDGLVMKLVPREEWQQLFDDTWRRYRDFFYDPEMHGLDWNAMREQYGALIADARTRWDVNNIIFHLLGETSAGHTYVSGGDTESGESRETGYLGIDWRLDDGTYQVARIARPAPWDTEVRSPFDITGVDVSEGDYILSVNGRDLDPGKDPYAAFEGLSGKVISLRVSSDSDGDDARTVIVKALTQAEEENLRYLEWIDNNRKMVDELSDGRLGYVYMSNTAARGQRELVRMFYGQLDKEGFIIDERFNGGGQLADRFLELMQRPIVYNLHWRHGRDHAFPIKTNPGPMGMLINGWAASGGDGLPWAFQELQAGPIVGENTMGILVGPATGHTLIDGGRITVPGARLYDNDGHWFWEGEGVSPDIEVWDDPGLLAQGRDPQMERVVEEVLKLLETAPPPMTPAPPREDRMPANMTGN